MQSKTSGEDKMKSSVGTGSVAVMIPCYNEELTVAKVVSDFKALLPGATVYVYDNNSTDRTIEVATSAGAVVGREPLQGKGNVVRRMFADIEADIYVLVDGDDTYSADRTAEAIDIMTSERLDMIVGVRKTHIDKAYRFGHRFGNQLFTGLVASVFSARTKDMLSGYRVFSRRFVKSFPGLSRGFEIETELTVHALELRVPMMDIEITYKDRPEGSESKLSTVRDGVQILKAILFLLKEERPFQFFSAISGLLFLVALVLGIPVVSEYVETGLVPRLPTAVLSSSLVVLSALLFVSGLIMDAVSGGRRETKRLHYLQYPALTRPNRGPNAGN
jgi:glycosyltransferase involved in cell wall biosynthesis